MSNDERMGGRNSSSGTNRRVNGQNNRLSNTSQRSVSNSSDRASANRSSGNMNRSNASRSNTNRTNTGRTNANAQNRNRNASTSRQRGSNQGRRPNPNGTRNSGRKKSSKKTIAIIIAELLIIAICVVAAYFLFIRTDVTKITEVNLDDEEVQENISDSVKNNEAMSDYWNIALFGVDSRDDVLDSGTRTDTIIIASINQTTGEIKLCSVYRDTYLNLQSDDGDTYSKCNAAYAYGGPTQAINMLNANLDMDIEDFVTIGFGGLVDIINDLGGVEISIEEDEILHLNNYQSTMATDLGIDYTPVTTTGTQTLDGLQATAYCRIRYTSGNDFTRAARQREVIQAILDKAQTADVSTLIDIANSVFDEMATSLELSKIIDLVSDVSSYSIVGDDGFPQESMRATGKVDGASIVAPVTLESNVVWLHEFLFDDTDYEVSDTVKEYSEVIAAKTASITN